MTIVSSDYRPKFRLPKNRRQRSAVALACNYQG
jgi:hypothetical protein